MMTESEALLRWGAEGVFPPVEEGKFYLLRDHDPPGSVWLLARLDGDARALPLEEEPELAAEGSVGVALAADDDGAWREQLAEAAAEESAATGAPILPVRSGRQARRLRSLLEHSRLRTWLVPGQDCLCAVVPLSDPALRLSPIHRAISWVPTFEPGRFLTLVREYARIYDLAEPLGSPGGLALANAQMAELSHEHHVVLLVLPGGRGKILRFRQAMELDHVRAAPRSPTLRSLDLALLNSLVLRTVLGLERPESKESQHVVRVATLEGLVAGVERGDYQAGFGLSPPPTWEVRAVIEASQTLPPATLWIEPPVPMAMQG